MAFRRDEAVKGLTGGVRASSSRSKMILGEVLEDSGEALVKWPKEEKNAEVAVRTPTFDVYFQTTV